MKALLRADNGKTRRQTIVTYEEARKFIEILEKRGIPFIAVFFDEDGVASSEEGGGYVDSAYCREIHRKSVNEPLHRIEEFE